MRMATQKVGRRRDKIVLQPTFRLSFEGEKKHIIVDQTDALLLRHISEKNSLTKAAKAAGISYRNAWDRISALESKIGQHIVETKIGGREGGGARLTDRGAALLKEFRRVRKYLSTPWKTGSSGSTSATGSAPEIESRQRWSKSRREP